MRRNNILVLAIAFPGIWTSCLNSYDPEIPTDEESKYVVSGNVNDGGEMQTVNVSISSPVDNPQYIPVIHCHIMIIDDQGNIFPMSGDGNGNYTTTIDPAFLLPGKSFMVEIFTPKGECIVSDFDTLSRGPKVGAIYYELDEKQFNFAQSPVKGIRFYQDFQAGNGDSKYYRMEAYETWEYHTPYPVEWYYNGTIQHVIPPDSSRMICWRTLRLPDIFTLRLDDLLGNRYDHFPLHFVSNRTTKLAYGYSLLVKQYSLSREAFQYFEDLRVNSNPDGGLYQQQPLAIRGNLHNTTHPEKEVLGFFSVSTLRSKRIFVYPVPDLELDYDVLCEPQEIIGGFGYFKPKDYPIYLLGDAHGYSNYTLDEECVNCLVFGGVNSKPEFWPQ